MVLTQCLSSRSGHASRAADALSESGDPQSNIHSQTQRHFPFQWGCCPLAQFSRGQDVTATNAKVTSATNAKVTSATNVKVTSATNVKVTSATNVKVTSATNVNVTSATNVKVTFATNAKVTSATNAKVTSATNVKVALGGTTPRSWDWKDKARSPPPPHHHHRYADG